MVHMATAARAKPEAQRFTAGDEVPRDIDVWGNKIVRSNKSSDGSFAMCFCDTCRDKSENGIRFSWTDLLKH